MSNLSNFIDCPNILRNLNGYFGTNPQLYVEPLVLTSFLNSPANEVEGLEYTVKEQVAPGGGKRRVFEVTYSPRMLESDVAEGTGRDLCESSNVIGETSSTYYLDDTDYVSHSFTFNFWDLKKRCEANSDYFSRTLQQLMDVVARKKETMLFSELAALSGKFAANEPNVTDDVKAIATAYANGTLDPKGMANVVTATRYAGYSNGPIIIGGRAMDLYTKELNAGCCSIDGVNVAELIAQYGYSFLQSYRADDIFGDTGFMSVNRGAAQVLEWSQFEGNDPSNFNYIDTPQLKAMTIVDPRTGSKYDFKMVMDCELNVNVFIIAWFKTVALPSDAFFPGDRLNGVNWINTFEIDNPEA